MIAIHDRTGSFSDVWIRYCIEKGIAFKTVDCLASDALNQCEGCEALLWHWLHYDPVAMQVARRLIPALEERGVNVFPSVKESWHFDDKIGQGMLFQAAGVPAAQAHWFVRKGDALEYAKRATWPMVFKLARGAGSISVKLVESEAQARGLINRSFGRGWSYQSQLRAHALKEGIRKARRAAGLDRARFLLKGIGRCLIPATGKAIQGPEKGYVYFQDFIPNMDHDIRVITMGNKAIAIKRMVRAGDFRASGSGDIDYCPDSIAVDYIQQAFENNRLLGVRCMAYDFVRGQEGQVLTIECGYAYVQDIYRSCPGYWSQDLVWHGAKINPEEMVLDAVLLEVS